MCFFSKMAKYYEKYPKYVVSSKKWQNMGKNIVKLIQKSFKICLFLIYFQTRKPRVLAPGFRVRVYTLKTRDPGFGFPGLRPLIRKCVKMVI